ncbi:MAG: CDP-alcohol phosphatidyltransferase family protein, partial [Planctomycetaceae bacterium]|nr:CDP-alcohol phosphatidyltransferase family protein [Planctomycetaceae bacterium]
MMTWMMTIRIECSPVKLCFQDDQLRTNLMTERILNAPNTISLLRLILSFVVFAMISLTDWWTTIAVLFVIAVSTDAVDG